MQIAKITFFILIGIITFWMFGMKIIVKFLKKGAAPCPASLAWLVNSPFRRYYMRPVLDRVGLKPGEIILELGPGAGAFTIDAANRLLPNGKLIAIDIQKKMIEIINEKIAETETKNVETHVASAYELPLEDNSVDRAFLVTVLPEIPDPVRGLTEIFRVLKPGGILSTTEEFLDPDYPTRKTTTKWAKQAGFECIETYGNFYLYTMNFKKSGNSAHVF